MELHILQICPKPPHPLMDGGCIAMNALTQGLTNAGHKVQVVAMVTSKHPHIPEAFSSDYFEKHKYSHVNIQTELNPFRALLCLLNSKNYNLDRFYSSEFNQNLINILSSDDFDTNFRGRGAVISGRGLKLQPKSIQNRECIDNFYIY